jgi:N-acetylneuraminic acid mutarotase
LDLKDPAKGWQVLPDYPGDPRQELCGVVVGSELSTWGGFSYAPRFTYRDGYRLSRNNGRWQWNGLAPLPWPMCSMSCAAIGDSIFVFGGADFRLPENKYRTNSDFSGKLLRIGARLHTLKTVEATKGFTERAACPGTPRFVAAMAAVKGKLYVIGGATGQDNPTGQYCTVIDNWLYDPAADRWSRLRDMPIATGNFPAGAIVYNDRYILLIGGFQYANVMGPDGKTRKSFGKITKHYPEKDYCSDILVFDTKTNTFGDATPLPLNNNMPMAVVRGDELHLIGGETAGSVIDGEPYAHHPDLYLIGKLSKATGRSN